MNLQPFTSWVPGIRKTLHSEILTEFHISKRFQDRLAKYYILHWTGEHLKEQNSTGYITHQGIKYIPLPAPLKDGSHISMYHCYVAKQVALSFRKLASDDYPLGYVMIKILEN
jgi:hypothetical protein